jgi:hypothetical protein
MKLTVDEFIHFISFVRRSDNEGQLGSINIYGTDMQECSSDEDGFDPYYKWVSLSFEDEDGEEHEIAFEDTTKYTVNEAMWRLVDALPIT